MPDPTMQDPSVKDAAKDAAKDATGKDAPSDITIRPVRAADGSNGLWSVYSQLTSAPPVPTARLESLIAELNADPHRDIIVAVRGDRVLGTASLLLERKLIRAGALCAHIEDVVVDSSARGLGLGRRLVEHLTSIARARGAYKVILDCSRDNVEFYGRCGFSEKEVQMVLYFDKS